MLCIGTKPNLSLYSPYYAEACNEFAVPNSASKHQSNTAACVDVEAAANRLQCCEYFPAPGFIDLPQTRHVR